MYTAFQLAKKYIQYYWQASNGKGHGIHSPFVFDFICNVLNNKKNYIPPPAIEAIRGELLQNDSEIETIDLGAGSRKGRSNKKKVSSLAKAALKPPKYAQVLYRLVRRYQPGTVVELGTSLGITTAYLAAASNGTKVITIEGSDAIAKLAAVNFKKLSAQNIEIRTGNFDDVLPTVIDRLTHVALAYIDGNHRYGPTMRYFYQLMAKANDQTILVFDDIHWSEEMEKAWEEIKAHPAVRYTIDIFFLGFVFLRNDFKVPQHFTIRF